MKISDIEANRRSVKRIAFRWAVAGESQRRIGEDYGQGSAAISQIIMRFLSRERPDLVGVHPWNPNRPPQTDRKRLVAELFCDPAGIPRPNVAEGDRRDQDARARGRMTEHRITAYRPGLPLGNWLECSCGWTCKPDRDARKGPGRLMPAPHTDGVWIDEKTCKAAEAHLIDSYPLMAVIDSEYAIAYGASDYQSGNL